MHGGHLLVSILSCEWTETTLISRNIPDVTASEGKALALFSFQIPIEKAPEFYKMPKLFCYVIPKVLNPREVERFKMLEIQRRPYMHVITAYFSISILYFLFLICLCT